MRRVELTEEDFTTDGLVKIGAIPQAIARARPGANLVPTTAGPSKARLASAQDAERAYVRDQLAHADAERKIGHYLNAAVRSGVLTPVDPDTLEQLPSDDYGSGVVPFAQVVEWAKSTGFFEVATPARTGGARTSETQEQRRARRYQMCVDAGLQMPDNDYASLPRGVGALAAREGVSRPAFTEDVKAHIRSLQKASGGNQ